MPFLLQPASIEDVHKIVFVFQAAFRDDPIISQLMCDAEPSTKYNYDIANFSKYIRDGHLTGSRFVKVIRAATLQLVGFAKWQFPYTLTEEQKAEKEASYTKRAPYPEGTNETLYKEFFAHIDPLREKYIDESKDYFLHILGVLPEHQGKGIGSMLIRHGLDAADRDNAKTYIESNGNALALYKKFGWKEVDEIKIDMGKHGGSGVRVETCLIREPGAG